MGNQTRIPSMTTKPPLRSRMNEYVHLERKTCEALGSAFEEDKTSFVANYIMNQASALVLAIEAANATPPPLHWAMILRFATKPPTLDLDDSIKESIEIVLGYQATAHEKLAAWKPIRMCWRVALEGQARQDRRRWNKLNKRVREKHRYLLARADIADELAARLAV
jgi:hypothetical protein